MLEHLASLDIDTPVRLIGLPDEFVEHGSREELLAHCRLDPEGIRGQIDEIVETALPTRRTAEQAGA